MAHAKRRKSAAIILAAVGVVGLSLASAAQLNLGPDDASLGAGTKTVVACQTAPITVGFETAFSAANSRYDVDQVVLKDLATACEGKKYALTLLAGVTEMVEVTGTVPVGGVIEIGDNISAAAVTNVALVIHG